MQNTHNVQLVLGKFNFSHLIKIVKLNKHNFLTIMASKHCVKCLLYIINHVQGINNINCNLTTENCSVNVFLKSI